MDVHAQASWIIKKSLWCSKDYFKVLINGSVFQQANFSIKIMYNALRGLEESLQRLVREK